MAALLLGSAAAARLGGAEPEDEQLYRRAAAALESPTPHKALPLLRQLVDIHPSSPLAQQAVVRIAELELNDQRAESATTMLLDWQAAVWPPASESGTAPDEEIAQRALQLLATALAALPPDGIDWLARWAEEHAVGSLTPAAALVIRELAKRKAQQGEFSRSLDWLGRLGNQATERERWLMKVELPLQMLHQRPSQESLDRVRALLDDAAELPDSQRLRVRLALAEGLRAVGDCAASLEQLDQLQAELGAQTAKSTSAQASDSATSDWQHGRASIDLRRGELRLLLNDRAGAVQLLANCLECYPDFPRREEFRFLLARCAIADIEFEQAIGHLQAIIDQSAHQAEPRARAIWMLGEIYLLQRNYARAVQHYGEVILLDGQPQWQARGLLQYAKCQELLAEPTLAVQAYRRVIEQFPESDVAAAARQRLDQLGNWQDQRLESAQLPNLAPAAPR